MATDVEVRIFGICLCFYTAPYWNVIFPCDSHHVARYCHADGSGELRVETRLIEITVDSQITKDNAVPYDPNPTGVKLFNMSDTYSHEYVEFVIGGRKSNLKLLEKEMLEGKDPDGNFFEFVWLKIPNATLSAQTPTDSDYYVLDVTGPLGLPPDIIDPVARQVILRFTATGNLLFVVKDKRDGTYSGEFEPPSKPDPISGKLLIEIDNDCHRNCLRENDFLHLYRIVKDLNPVLQKRRRFAAGQVKYKKKGGSKEVKEPNDQKRATLCTTAKTTTYGNCDPVESNPPPGPQN